MGVKYLFLAPEIQNETIILSPGTYKIECWGAQGKDFYGDVGTGGRGGYVSGLIRFTEPQQLFVYVGGQGVAGPSYNGGGSSQGGGGGASDVRLTGGEWSDFESLMSRIIVAGGGGGTDGYFLDDTHTDQGVDYGGAAGGLVGFDSMEGHGKGGSQKYTVDAGKFGQGTGNSLTAESGHGAGGGGYFGGSESDVSDYYGGGGGSSYISGYNGCLAINKSSTQDNIIMTNQSIHFSQKFFFMMDMIDGRSRMPSPHGGFEEGHIGAGAVRISLINLLANTCQQRFKLNLYLILFIPLSII